MKRLITIEIIFIFIIFIFTPVFADTESAKEHFDLAVKYYLSHNFDGALDELSKSLAVDANYVQANKLLPIVLKKKDDELRSKSKQKPSLTKEEITSAEEHFNWALKKYFNNDLYGAIDELNQTLNIQPEHKKANELFSTIIKKIESELAVEELTPLNTILPTYKRKEKIKVTFKDEDINVALRTLSQLLNINIVFSQDVTGKINANFADATPEEVLSAILKSIDATYFVDGSVVRIVKIDQEKFLTKIFKLKHTTLSSNQINDIKSVLSDRSKLLYEPKSRTLMITDDYSKIHDIEEMVKKIDFSRPQVYIETKVVEVVASKVRNLGVKWEQNLYAKISGSKRPITFPFDQGVVHDNNPLETFLPRSKPAEEDEIGDFPVDGTTTFPYAGADDFTFGSIETGSIKWTLDFLDTDSDTDVLASPRLLAIDDEESEIVIGTTIPIPTYERNATTGEMEITGYEDKEVGILLRVTPKIHKDNNITLTLHPEVSEIIGYTGPNNERPIISTREVTTQLVVRNGSTIVIGGLTKEKNIDSVTKIPFLGDIPLLNALFKHKSKTKEKTEVLIFLTVNITKDSLPQS